MSPRKRVQEIRLKYRKLKLQLSIKHDDVRIWWLGKKLSYLEWKRALYERQQLVEESRDFQEGQNDE